MKPLSKESAKTRIASLCSRTEVCEAEARRKMLGWGVSAEDTEEIIDFLVESGFVDDARYARAFANDKMRFSAWGRMKIAMALRAKQIDSRRIDEALNQIDHDIYARTLMKTARNLAKSLDLNDYAQRVKLYRRLMSRGYESPLITSAIGNLRKEQAEQ